MSRPAMSSTERPGVATIWAALSAVYVIWGTTYLAIRVVNETLPPLLSASIRFLVAGALMFAWTIRRGDRESDRPTRIQWRSAAIIGTLLILGGNGGVVWAERTIPSGIAALLVALVPLWMALLDRLFFGGHLPGRAVLGLVGGFGGAALLLGSGASGDVDLVGMLFVVGASLAWAIGSLYSRNAPLPNRPFVGVAMEMLVGGLALAIAGVLAGELGQIDVSRFSTASLIGLLYLIVFGSWVGFTAYLWLLRTARTSLVSTYAYVNPVVAVFLGWLILDEPVKIRTVVAGAIIVASVALIISAGGAHREQEAAVAPESETPAA
ncbi:MAG TPA: EamA family transporter [Actinomycetota bacterium]|nr:EamA family transporter [Actinomycetota bacterium]